MGRWFGLSLVAAVMAAVVGAPGRAVAADSQACMGLVSQRDLPIQRVAVGPGEVGLTFVGHATFLIETPGGILAATDYNDYVRPSAIPDLVTMNHAHGTHFTNAPDPRIKHVLRGWNVPGVPARHDVTVGDLQVRNVPTSIRNWNGGTEHDGNSIFVFQAAGLCIAHLGHLHHTLNASHLKLLGHIDVLLVPVDGNYTLDMDGMLEVLRSINAPLMIPMHYFGSSTLNRFLARVQENWTVERSPTASITLSRASLPPTPKVLVLPGN
ncbi:MBL fold metallo-hydrolase [uncultured Alsobacter sp.]|uniref:MBL fold metallo-hydrolase n=1 Tax=uncultured Alsobacter sp. TaxID=1748258 RepID=UPI0026005AAA|nr:MBL fold metallo-hydrolase [uncultured Alsobacter sp.]